MKNKKAVKTICELIRSARALEAAYWMYAEEHEKKADVAKTRSEKAHEKKLAEECFQSWRTKRAMIRAYRKSLRAILTV